MQQRLTIQPSSIRVMSRRVRDSSELENTLTSASLGTTGGPHFQSNGPPIQSDRSPLVGSATNDKGKRPAGKSDGATAQSNPWKGSRVDLLSVLFNLGTYALLVSDVPRAGVLTRLNMREMSPGVFSWFGSFAYQVITIYRDADNLANITAVKYDNIVPHARVWSYNYDTTSIGLRTITSQFNDTDKYILNCMSYRIHCGALTFFTPSETFSMLDRLIGYPASIPDAQLPSMNKAYHIDAYQHLRWSKIVKNRHVYIFNDYLVQWPFDPVQHRLIRGSAWLKVNDSFNMCADPRDRPYICDSGTFSDYGYSADKTDPESAEVTFVWASMNDKVQKLYHQYHNLTSNMTLEVLIVEGYTEPMSYTGGLSSIVSWEFDMVLFTRVRDCSRQVEASLDPDMEPCITTRVQDYRYEGASVHTDVQDWNRCITFLRVFAQFYFIVRVITLFLGCYYAFPKHQRSWPLTVFIFTSEVPSQVIAFGSFIPILFYTAALWIDGPIVNAIIHSGGLGLQGNFLKDPGGVYLLICLLMRKQWLMAFLSMLWVRFQVSACQFNRQLGVTSIRGHIFGILSSMTMVAGYYNPKLRDTRVLGLNPLNPDRSVVSARLMAPDEINRRLGGFYTDLFTIALSGVLYVGIVLVLRTLVLGVSQLCSMLATPTRTASSPSEQLKGMRARRNRIIGRRSFFTCQIDCLPSTCNTLWMIEGLTCAWTSDVFLSMAAGPRQEQSLIEQSRRDILMNIVQMSEPLNYLRLRLGFNSQKVYTYMEVATQRTFMTVNKVSRDRVLAKENKHCVIQVVRKRNANDLSFHELVRIR